MCPPAGNAEDMSGHTIPMWCILNHFSHNGLATYDEIVKQAKPYGFLVSYDGMTVEF